MAVDQRDHYIERLRERTGYTERASFRVPLGRPRWIKPTEGPSAGVAVLVAIVGALAAVALLALVLRS
jgi:hypothetical protein